MFQKEKKNLRKDFLTKLRKMWGGGGDDILKTTSTVKNKICLSLLLICFQN
jgi:hypothetical protein